LALIDQRNDLWKFNGLNKVLLALKNLVELIGMLNVGEIEGNTIEKILTVRNQNN
jgi:hypothetical protein